MACHDPEMVKVYVDGGPAQGRYENLKHSTSATIAGEEAPSVMLWAVEQRGADDAMASWLTEAEAGPRFRASEIEWRYPPVGGYAQRVADAGRRDRRARP